MSAFLRTGLLLIMLQWSVVAFIHVHNQDTYQKGCSGQKRNDGSAIVFQTEHELRVGKNDDSPNTFAINALIDIWSHPITWGLALGILLIGPDHLGTLMALSTLTTGISSFKVGFAWGIGHSIGMILILPLFYLLKKFSTRAWEIDVGTWEYWGDHCIGASMILISIYFVLYEHHYIEAQEDGTYIMKGCSCCTEEHDEEADMNMGQFCGTYGTAAKKRTTRKDHRSKRRSSSQWSSWWRHMWSVRDWKGAMIGIVQGLCCPTGLMGIGFMGRMSSSSSLTLLIGFGSVFVLTSGIGSGAITLLWGMLSSNGISSCCSPRMMYHSSCVATALLGVLWIIANVCGFLHHINYTEKLHHSMESLQSF